MQKNERSETNITTVSIKDNIVSVCASLQGVKPFTDYKKSLELDLSGLPDLVRMALSYFYKHPPSIDQIRELRRVTTNDESLFLFLSDLLEESK